MPAPIRRSRRREPARESFSVEIETVTPILGGAPETRKIDMVDTIRVPTIRGHLRSWWRALQRDPELLSHPTEFAAAESAIWGKAADEKGGRSPVEITVEVVARTQPENGNIEINSPAGYALWPARGTRNEPVAPRRRPGVRFQLSVLVSQEHQRTVLNAVRAWVLFGGYGSRTRRGVGSLTVRADRRNWLPSAEDDEGWQEELRESLATLVDPGMFSPLATAPSFPVLAGSILLVGELTREAQASWHEALGWLRTFRQGVGVGRERGSGARPGRSRWPEADKLRHLTGRFGHEARYADQTPAWPRAEFGLPIVGQFGGLGEPNPFQLTWQAHHGPLNPQELIRDRMASPLIVKALPTVQGFRPCAIWLARANPPGEVIAMERDERTGKSTSIPGSNARFGFVGSAADQRRAIDLRAPLARKGSVKAAFLDWVKTKDGVVQVAP
jgi:CRISPR-associated protein Cmr1